MFYQTDAKFFSQTDLLHKLNKLRKLPALQDGTLVNGALFLSLTAVFDAEEHSSFPCSPTRTTCFSEHGHLPPNLTHTGTPSRSSGLPKACFPSAKQFRGIFRQETSPL